MFRLYRYLGNYILEKENKLVRTSVAYYCSCSNSDRRYHWSCGVCNGCRRRGPVNKPVFITSWNAFVTNFALGCDSPFFKDSYLAYSIYGFFQNGGKRCYVMRVAGTGYACATAQYSETPDRESESVLKFTISAKDEGTWANGFKVYVKANEDDATLFDIVTLDGSGNVVEVVEGLSNSSADDNYWFTTLESMSDYIKAGGTTEAATLVAIEKDNAIVLANGNDGANNLCFSHFIISF